MGFAYCEGGLNDRSCQDFSLSFRNLGTMSKLNMHRRCPPREYNESNLCGDILIRGSNNAGQYQEDAEVRE